MLVGVPAKRAYPVPWLQAEVPEGYGELLGARDEVGVGVSVERLVETAGDDLAVPVELLSPAQEVGKGKLEILDKSLCISSPL